MAHQIDVVGGKVDDHARIPDTSGVGAQTSCVDLVHAADHSLVQPASQLHDRWIEALDVANGQDDAFGGSRVDDFLAFGHRARDGLLDQ